MSILQMCQWLQDTSFGTSLRESTWAFPIVEGTHLLGIAISVGTLLVLDLRLAGWLFQREPVSGVARAVMPVSILGFTVMFITGILLFWCQAVKAEGSIYFRIKIVLLVLAGVNALIFELTQRKRRASWDTAPVPPLRVRLAGIAGIVLWAGVICAGRTMAYNF
jgi:phosphoglycerol transferase MdoB-like AlkP superfamily enzyme